MLGGSGMWRTPNPGFKDLHSLAAFLARNGDPHFLPVLGDINRY